MSRYLEPNTTKTVYMLRLKPEHRFYGGRPDDPMPEWAWYHSSGKGNFWETRGRAQAELNRMKKYESRIRPEHHSSHKYDIVEFALMFYETTDQPTRLFAPDPFFRDVDLE